MKKLFLLSLAMLCFAYVNSFAAIPISSASDLLNLISLGKFPEACFGSEKDLYCSNE
jgi:hypothetical protein